MATSVGQIERMLRTEPGFEPSGLHEVGRGMWSIAYRFASNELDLVVRVGRHVEDFKADRAAARFRGSSLPIPEVHAIGAIDNEFYCVSDFAHGTPLEDCSPDEWRAVVPSLVDALEAMRECAPRPSAPSWRKVLLAIDDDHVGTRADGWRAKIQHSVAASEAFAAGVDALARLDLSGVDASLTHGDLINRNVHVDSGRVSGIFDWGCLRWGDHLYDLAWFDFWSPWHPNLDVNFLRDQLDQRWVASGYAVINRAARERASLTHIGVEHLVYNSTIESWSDLDDVVARMIALDLV